MSDVHETDILGYPELETRGRWPGRRGVGRPPGFESALRLDDLDPPRQVRQGPGSISSPSISASTSGDLKPELPSRLVESLLLEIPIPPIYFGKVPGGKLEVIDGQQRLTTLIPLRRERLPASAAPADE